MMQPSRTSPPADCRRQRRYYHSHNTGLQAQNVVYSQASLDSEPVKLLDPNTLSKDGTVSPQCSL